MMKGGRRMIIVSKEELLAFKKLDLLYQMNLLQEQSVRLERKYDCSLEEFRSLVADSDENYEMWDDLIEWEACNSALLEVRSMLERINAEDIEVR
jgi:hypothetical protein